MPACSKEAARRREEEEARMNEETVDYEQLANVRADLLKHEQEADAIRERGDGGAGDVGGSRTGDRAVDGDSGSKDPGERAFAAFDARGAPARPRARSGGGGRRLLPPPFCRSRVQLSPRRRPASFIFVGPTGVGKTELVKTLAGELFDSPETLIRLDMSEFMEKHAVSRIIGSPPGYVGYDEAGQLTEKVRRKPYSVILFDEIEKAHPDVLNILLQILDEGRVTDAHGRTVNFENTVIVMTSNAGSQFKETLMGFGKTDAQASRDKAERALSEFLRPEFLARVDEIVYFRPLGAAEYAGDLPNVFRGAETVACPARYRNDVDGQRGAVAGQRVRRRPQRRARTAKCRAAAGGGRHCVRAGQARRCAACRCAGGYGRSGQGLRAL